MKIKSILTTTLAVTALAGILASGGCASINETGGKGRQALVCPQCKMVAVNRPHSYFSGGGRGTYPGYGGPQTVYKHTCPGCQGALETLFKEGKLKHKCSLCKDSPYTCPIFHP